MNTFNNTATVTQQVLTATQEPSAETNPAVPLEVNVIFTGPRETSAALKVADSLAHDLGACVHVCAAIPVPFRLGLNESPVSIPFMEARLRELIIDVSSDGTEYTVHLYVCRDSIKTLIGTLKPKSLVVIGGRKHWWPTAEKRLEKLLSEKGHRVVFVDTGK